MARPFDAAPLQQLIVTSPFGATEGRAAPHKGVDLRASPGTPVFAVGPGVVDIDDDDAGGAGGVQVVLQLDNGWRAGYSHLTSNFLAVGQRVHAGEVIGLSGETGEGITGPHLHFEARPPPVRGVRQDLVDPMRVLTGSSGGGFVLVAVLVVALSK